MRPAFSVLLPTKNRPEILGDAIKSVLQQTFTDFELIISVNDDRPKDSVAVVQRFNDPRIQCVVTTGDLSMPANWEHALSWAKGEYITVIEDKMVLYPHALQELYTRIVFSEAEAAMWRYDTWQDNNTLIKFWGKGTSQSVPSEWLVKNFIEHGFQFGMALRQNCNTMLPRMINSCIKREVVTKIQETSPAFFLPISPDFTSAFQQLKIVKEVLFIDAPLSIWGPASKSNAKVVRQAAGRSRFFEDIAKDWDIPNLIAAPIKSERLVNNNTYSDYLRLMPTGPRLSGADYALMIFLDMVRTYKTGMLSSEEFLSWVKFTDKELSGTLLGGFFKTGFMLPLRGALYKAVRPTPVHHTPPRPGHWSLLSGFKTSLEAASAISSP